MRSLCEQRVEAMQAIRRMEQEIKTPAELHAWIAHFTAAQFHDDVHPLLFSNDAADQMAIDVGWLPPLTAAAWPVTPRGHVKKNGMPASQYDDVLAALNAVAQDDNYKFVAASRAARATFSSVSVRRGSFSYPSKSTALSRRLPQVNGCEFDEGDLAVVHGHSGGGASDKSVAMIYGA